MLQLVLLIKIATTYAQTPDNFRYQGTARNATGTALLNTAIKLRITIREGSAVGVPVYSEIKTVMTDARGLFVTHIGTVPTGAGNAQSGTIAAIDWTKGTKFLQVEMDPLNGNKFVNMGTSQLATVPFSGFADYAGRINAPSGSISSDKIEAGNAKPGQVLRWDGLNWVPFYLPPIQTNLPISVTKTTGDTIFYENYYKNSTFFSLSANQTPLKVTTASSPAVEGNSVVVENKNTGNGLFVLANRAEGATGLTATAINGSFALKANGRLRFSGGNTTPVDKGILETDENGFAKWSPRKVGFQASSSQGLNFSGVNGWVKPQLDLESFDLGNNFVSVGDSKFTAPFKGLYSFKGDARVVAIDNSSPDLYSAKISFRVFRNGGQINTHENRFYDDDFQVPSYSIHASTDFYLNAGDVVDMIISAAAEDVNPRVTSSNFSGAIRYAE